MSDNSHELVSGTVHPLAVLGAGELVSHLRKTVDAEQSGEYLFNIFRVTPEGEVTHTIRPDDLVDVVKLCRVIAFAVVDDGWIQADERERLNRLCEQLDAFLLAEGSNG